MPETSPTEITRLLTAAAAGSDADRQHLLNAIYSELHGLAGGMMRRERPDHTLQPTALVHEAFMRLFGTGGLPFENRAHLFGAAAEAMRRILVDHARRRGAQKRAGPKSGIRRLPFEESALSDQPCPPDSAGELLAIDEALQALEAADPRKAEIVKLRFYGGLTVEEIAGALDIAPITVKRDWRFARAWLLRRLGHDDPGPGEDA